MRISPRHLHARLCVAAVLGVGFVFLASPLFSAEAVTPRKLDDSLQLMVDRSIIDTFVGQASLRLGVPIGREVVVASEKPWEGRAFFISSIYKHDGLYYMLYRGMNTESGKEGPDEQYLCMAMSKDGVKWDKPSLGLVESKGSKDNNIVAYENGKAFPACFTFYDPRPGTPSNERLKAIDMRDGARRAGGAGKGLRAQLLGSADGRVWHELSIKANLESDLANAFDGGSVCWSEAEQAFVGYFRWWDTAAPTHPRTLPDWMIGRPGVRTSFRSISRDLVTWSKPEPMNYGETPREHFYENRHTPTLQSG